MVIENGRIVNELGGEGSLKLVSLVFRLPPLRFNHKIIIRQRFIRCQIAHITRFAVKQICPNLLINFPRCDAAWQGEGAIGLQEAILQCCFRLHHHAVAQTFFHAKLLAGRKLIKARF